jgi:hypothetical protein
MTVFASNLWFDMLEILVVDSSGPEAHACHKCKGQDHSADGREEFEFSGSKDPTEAPYHELTGEEHDANPEEIQSLADSES